MVQQRRICVRAKITCSKFILPNYRLINHGLQTLVFNPGIKRVLTNIESSSEYQKGTDRQTKWPYGFHVCMDRL